MSRSRIVAVLAAVGMLAAFGAGTAVAKPADYTLGGTRSCLVALPHAIAGLPPTRPVGRPAVFVYKLGRLSMDSIVFGGARKPHTQIGAWDGAKYAGIIFNFFKSVSDARLSYKALTQLYGGERFRNVVATWDGFKPSKRVRKRFLGCLRSGVPSSPGSHPRPVPAASLSTFVGGWGGHGRGLSLSKAGVGNEYVNASCCVRIYDLSYQVTSVTGTLTRATATYSVAAFTDYGGGPTISVGDIGKLRLKNGIVTNTLTRYYGNFCGGVAWGASRTGGCGA